MRIHRKIHGNIEIESIILTYFFFVVLFSGYLEHAVIWNVLSIGCLLVLCTTCIGLRIISKNKKIVTWLILTFGMLIICTVSSIGNMEYYFANIRSILYPICVILSVYIIQARKPNLIIGKLEKSCFFCNAWLLLNLVILNQQVNRNFIFIKDSWLQENPYWRDHCDGLFGMNSTDIIGYFVIIVIILNVHCANKYIKKRWKRNIVFIYSGLIAGVALYLFTKNDGVAEFVLLPLVVVYQILIQYDRKSIVTKAQKIGKYVVIFVIVILALTMLESVRTFISEKVIHKIETMLRFRTTTAEIRGSNERLAIAGYGLSHGWGWGLGKGIGYLKWQAQNEFGFDHFGISSIGSFINLTGIWFYLSICFLYTAIWSAVSEKCRRVKNKFSNYWIIFANVVLMTIYVFVFTEIRTNICLMFILIILYNTQPKSARTKLYE